MSARCRYCCKSPKLPGANFPAVKKSDRRPPIDVASIKLPGSPASFSSDDEVPRIFAWKSPVQPKEILIASAKRLLQQNLPKPAVSRYSNDTQLVTLFDHCRRLRAGQPRQIRQSKRGGGPVR